MGKCPTAKNPRTAFDTEERALLGPMLTNYSQTTNVSFSQSGGSLVLGKLPPGKSHPTRFSIATLFRFVARFATVRIEDSSRNRFASTAYFAKPVVQKFQSLNYLSLSTKGNKLFALYDHRE